MKFFRKAKKSATREQVIWCYRNLLQREPESEEAVLSHMTHNRDFKQLIEVFTNSAEFINKAAGQESSLATSKDDLPSAAGSQTPGDDNPLGLKMDMIKNLPAECFIDKRAALINGCISYPLAEKDKIRLVKIGYHGHSDPSALQGVKIELNSICELNIYISSSNCKFKIGYGSQGYWTFNLFREASIEMADNVTSNGSHISVDNGDLIIGDDCMFAVNTSIHVGDNHAIFDLKSGKCLNVRRAKVEFEPHVWIASRATVIGDGIIGAGSIIAANATVKGDVPRFAIVAGVPAHVIKSNVSWTRSPTGYEWQDVVRRLTEKGLL